MAFHADSKTHFRAWWRNIFKFTTQVLCRPIGCDWRSRRPKFRMVLAINNGLMNDPIAAEIERSCDVTRMGLGVLASPNFWTPMDVYCLIGYLPFEKWRMSNLASTDNDFDNPMLSFWKPARRVFNLRSAIKVMDVDNTRSAGGTRQPSFHFDKHWTLLPIFTLPF